MVRVETDPAATNTLTHLMFLTTTLQLVIHSGSVTRADGRTWHELVPTLLASILLYWPFCPFCSTVHSD